MSLIPVQIFPLLLGGVVYAEQSITRISFGALRALALGVSSERLFSSNIPAFWLHPEVWKFPSEISVPGRAFLSSAAPTLSHDSFDFQHCSHVSCMQFG